MNYAANNKRTVAIISAAFATGAIVSYTILKKLQQKDQREYATLPKRSARKHRTSTDIGNIERDDFQSSDEDENDDSSDNSFISMDDYNTSRRKRKEIKALPSQIEDLPIFKKT